MIKIDAGHQRFTLTKVVFPVPPSPTAYDQKIFGRMERCGWGEQEPSGVGWTLSIRKFSGMISNERGAMAGGDAFTEDKLESGDLRIHELSSISSGGQDKRGGGSRGSKKSRDVAQIVTLL